MSWSNRSNKLYWRCLRKKDFASEDEAKHAAACIRSRSTRHKDRRMVAYKCEYYDHWHVGHVKPDSRRWREIQEQQNG